MGWINGHALYRCGGYIDNVAHVVSLLPRKPMEGEVRMRHGERFVKLQPM